MKIIEAEGGTFVGLHRHDLHQWSGVFGNRFFGGKLSSDNDYDSLFELIKIENIPAVGVLKGDSFDLFFISSEPLPTFIVDAGGDHVYIAQIYTAEDGWSESQLGRSDFEEILEWKQNLEFSFPGGEIVFFDSAGNMEDIGSDCLKIFLAEGVYTFGWARQKRECQANLIFIRMVKLGAS